MVYYKNQTLTAKGINSVVDKYWALKINERELYVQIMGIIENNHRLVFKGDEFAPVIKQRVGKKRLRVVQELLGVGKPE